MIKYFKKFYIITVSICTVITAIIISGTFCVFYNSSVNYYKNIAVTGANTTIDLLNEDSIDALVNKFNSEDFPEITNKILTSNRYIKSLDQIKSVWRANQEYLYINVTAFREDTNLTLYDVITGNVTSTSWDENDRYLPLKAQILEDNKNIFIIDDYIMKGTHDTIKVLSACVPWFHTTSGHQVYITVDVTMSNINTMLWRNWLTITIPSILILVIIVFTCFIAYRRQCSSHRYYENQSNSLQDSKDELIHENDRLLDICTALAQSSFRIVYVEFETKNMYLVNILSNALSLMEHDSTEEDIRRLAGLSVLEPYRERLIELYHMDYLMKLALKGQRRIEYEYEMFHPSHAHEVVWVRLSFHFIYDGNGYPKSTILSYKYLNNKNSSQE